MSKLLIKGGTVVTMRPNRPDWETADILIENSKILAIGPNLIDDQAAVVNAEGKIIIPGLINAHLHTWQTGLRSIGTNWSLLEYLLKLRFGNEANFTPEDIRIGNYTGAINQINCGTTTLGDWCHNNPTPDHTNAAIEALNESGIRAVFFHGTPMLSAEEKHPRQEIERLAKSNHFSNSGKLSLAMAVNGPQYSTAASALADFELADEFDLVISMHQSGGAAADDTAWDTVISHGMVGPKTNIVHGVEMPDDLLKRLIEQNVTFTITPENELTQGHGYPISGKLLLMGAAPSLGTDVESVVSGEVLLAARFAFAQARIEVLRASASDVSAIKHTELTSKKALSWATVEGAKALAIDDHVGSLEEGMQADLVVINPNTISLWPPHDVIATAVRASTADIESVMIAGEWYKQDNSLIGIDLDKIRSDLATSSKRLSVAMDFPSQFKN